MAFTAQKPAITANFNDQGELVINSATVSVSAGEYPNNLTGTVTLTATDGVKLGMKMSDIQALAISKAKIIANEGTDVSN